MSDLFDTPPLPGLATRADLVTREEEQALIAAIDGAGLTPFQFHGWEGKRLTTVFGSKDDAAKGARPIPDWLLPLRARLAEWGGLAPSQLVQALLIRYDPGAGIGWHRDNAGFDQVFGLSLGAAADMRFRRRRESGGFMRVTVPLEPRGAYHMTGQSRYDWEHSITEMDKTRWSITFRTPAP